MQALPLAVQPQQFPVRKATTAHAGMELYWCALLVVALSGDIELNGFDGEIIRINIYLIYWHVVLNLNTERTCRLLAKDM
jgi:hypothetical protein